MIRLKLKDNKGGENVIDFPATLYELPYSRCVDYEVALGDIAIWMSEKLEAEKKESGFNKNDPYYCYLLARAVSGFLGMDIAKVMSFDVSDLVDSHGNLLPATLEANFTAAPLDWESVDITLSHLYRMANRLIKSYEFTFKNQDNCTFFHNDKIWAIPHVVKNLFDGRKVFSPMNVNQSVETMMIRSYLDTLKKNRDTYSRDGDTSYADQLFTAHMSIIAICVSPVTVNVDTTFDYEVLPFDESKFDAAVNDRVIQLQDISTQTAKDIVFFLTNTTNPYAATQRTTTITTSQRSRNRRRSRRRTAKR